MERNFERSAKQDQEIYGFVKRTICGSAGTTFFQKVTGTLGMGGEWIPKLDGIVFFSDRYRGENDARSWSVKRQIRRLW